MTMAQHKQKIKYLNNVEHSLLKKDEEIQKLNDFISKFMLDLEKLDKRMETQDNDYDGRKRQKPLRILPFTGCKLTIW